MYYPDLFPYPNKDKAPVSGYLTLSVGWLVANQPYIRGEVPVGFVDRLWIFCCNAVLYTLGYHGCPFCRGSPFGVVAQHGQEKRRLGSAEIRVLGMNNIIYAAPDLIYHYVVNHHYRPPSKFIQSVLEGPLPGSSEYKLILDVLKLTYPEWARD